MFPFVALLSHTELFELDPKILPAHFLDLRPLQSRLSLLNQSLFNVPDLPAHPHPSLDSVLKLLVRFAF
jgi:hypothetical protein